LNGDLLFMLESLTSADNARPQGDARPKVSIITVTYGSRNEIHDCIESLQKQEVPFEIFLVDNASPDDTAEVISDYATRFDNVHAILNKENIGLAAANNCPLGKCLGDYVLILNPDTLLRDAALATLVDFLDQHPEVGVVGPKNVYADGTPHSSSHRRWGLLQILLWRVLPYRFSRWVYDHFSSYEREDKLFVSGACLLIRRKTFEQIGGYDPEYFLTVEDACDLCIRAQATGRRVVFAPEAEVVHHGGRSGVQAPYIVVWQGYRGSIYHCWKHKGGLQAGVVVGLLLCSSGIRAVAAAAMGVFAPRYRRTAAIYGSVFWSLLTRNPMRTKGGRFNPSTSSESARFKGLSL
jgi:GT2 family glycosyltransferase